MGILCIGQAAYDITGCYPGPLAANQKYRFENSHRCPGAPALNAACLCAKWGAPTRLTARIGSDIYGHLILDELTATGVAVDCLVMDPAATTSLSVIAVDDRTGERTIFNMPASGGEAELVLPSEAPQVILSDGHEMAATLAALERFPEAQSLVDAGTYRESTYEVARHVSMIVCSEDFARQFTGITVDDVGDARVTDRVLAAIEDINDGAAVVTLGDRGLIYRDAEGTPRHLPAIGARAVDTTGAGDIFHGAFAWGMHEGLTLEDNLRLSTAASSLSVRSMGGFSSIPALDRARMEALVLEA